MYITFAQLSFYWAFRWYSHEKTGLGLRGGSSIDWYFCDRGCHPRRNVGYSEKVNPAQAEDLHEAGFLLFVFLTLQTSLNLREVLWKTSFPF